LEISAKRLGKTVGKKNEMNAEGIWVKVRGICIVDERLP
jgi:hypothetical protein